MTEIEDLLARTLSDDRRSLPAAADLVDRIRLSEQRLVARRRVTSLGAAAGITIVLAVGAIAFGSGDPEDTLLPGRNASATALASITASAVAAPTLAVPMLSVEPSPTPQPAATAERGVPGRVIGTVSDGRGRALEGIRVMSGDLQSLLGRTDADGAFSVPCSNGLVFAAYAFGPNLWSGSTARPVEDSPGLGNYAFRDRPTGDCGSRITVVMPAGGVVEGHADADPGRQVWLSRVTQHGDYADGTGRFGGFKAIVRPDGTYRIEGLATGQYSIDSSYEGFPDEATFVDVHEGKTSDGSYTYYVDPAVCYEQPDSPECSNPSASPEPSPTPTS